jgi:hypothetical protein
MRVRSRSLTRTRSVFVAHSSLFAFYEYGRLHGCVRLRWGFLDEAIPAPRVHRDELTLHDLKARALEDGRPLEVVVGNAPGWSDPWSRGRSATVVTDQSGWRLTLVGDDGFAIADEDVQAARFGARGRDASRGAG